MTLDIAAGNHPVGTVHIGSPKGREHRVLRQSSEPSCPRLQNSFKVKLVGASPQLLSFTPVHGLEAKLKISFLSCFS